MTETTEPQTPTIVDKPKRLRKQTVAIVAGALVVVAALGWGAFATWQKSVDENARISALDSGRNSPLILRRTTSRTSIRIFPWSVTILSANSPVSTPRWQPTCRT